MAVKRDPRQLEESAAFVESLFKAGGFATAADMALESGVHQTTISNYRRGHVMPEGYNLLRLIKATSDRLHADDATVALQALPPRSDLVAAMAQLEVVVARLAALAHRPGVLGDGQA